MKLFLVFLVPFFLISCSSTQQAYRQNIQIYLDSDVDVVFSDEEIQSAGVDLIYVRSGERPLATMALAFIEDGQYKWLSQDNAMLITQSGRIVRTVGFITDLIYVDNLASDPLIKRVKETNQAEWNYFIDTNDSVVGAPIYSSFTEENNVKLHIHQHIFDTRKLIEEIEFTSKNSTSEKWINYYWFDLESGQLLKSFQKPSTNLDTFEITYISRALRLLETKE